jgi:transposase
MEKTVQELMEAVSPEDWAQVPESVLNLIKELVRRVELLEQETKALRADNELLKEQVARTSANSSQPPSKNPQGFKPNRKEATGKKRGAQVGHQGHSQKLYPIEMCQDVIDYYSQQCSECGAEVFDSTVGEVYRHQVVEIPPIEPIIIEHRFHPMMCACCGKKNQAPEMAEVIGNGGYGPRVTAYISLLSSQYRQSYRQIQRAMHDVFGLEISLGTIKKLRTEVSEAVSGAVTDAINYMQQQPIVGVDETGFRQRNGDGQNESKTSGWLWVAVTPLIVCFQMILGRGREAAQAFLGGDFSGFIISDRCPAYNWVNVERRQLCWAHLKRDFIQIAERTGVSAEIGKALLEQEKKLFDLWYEFRNNQLAHEELVKMVEPIKAEVSSILKQAGEMQIGKEEKTPLAKTVRTCRKLLKVEVALWLFVHEEGVEPTNNESERAIRPAVIWRSTSFGSDSEAGSLFVSRLLTVVSSLDRQGRNVLEFLCESVAAARNGSTPPSLVTRPTP